MSSKIKIKGDDLRLINIYGYSVGHTINDITVTIMFNFLLYFLTEIINISNEQAGIISLIGSIADAILLLFLGLLIDRYGITWLGKKTSWYILGNIFSILGFILMFRISPFSESANSEYLNFVYYSVILVVYSLGYSVTNIAHIALIPSLSINRKSKDYMVRLRTGFRFIAQLMGVILSSILFYIITDKYSAYSIQALLASLIGACFSIFFLIFCREPFLNRNISKYYKDFKKLLNKQMYKAINDEEATEINTLNHYDIHDNNDNHEIDDDQNKYNEFYHLNNEDHEPHRKNSNRTVVEEDNYMYWLTLPLFYKYIVAYLTIHISVNITPSFIPFYMEKVLRFSKTESGGTSYEIAIFFLINTLGSIFSSLFIQNYIESYKSRFVNFFSAWVFTSIGCVPLIFLTYDYKFVIHILSFFMGIGFSLAINTSFILSNDVVGNKGSKGSFIFSIFGFLDRVVVGGLILVFMTYVKDNYTLMCYFFPVFPVILLFCGMLIVYHEETKIIHIKCESDPEHKICELLMDNQYLSFESVS